MTANWQHETRFKLPEPFMDGCLSVRSDPGLRGVNISLHRLEGYLAVRVTLAELAEIADMFAKALAAAEADAAEAELAKGAGNDAD